MPLHAAWINLLLLTVTLSIGWAFGRLGGGLARIAVALGLGVLVLGVLANLRPDLWSRWIPWRDLLFVSNLYPFAFALILPTAVFRQPARPGRLRLGILSILLTLASMRPSFEFLEPAARARITWVDRDGICRQSSRETCSAAALATVLLQHGIESNEKRIAELAWTRRERGTSVLGLYRAAVFLTDGRPELRPRIRRITAEELLASGRPAVVTVGLPRLGSSPAALEFGKAYEWEPGVLHDVAFLGRSPTQGLVRIGDPDFGLEEWPEEHLRYLHRGTALVLEAVPGR
jgi:hypothetical protein